MKTATDPTRAKIAEMMTENTGRHFLDSGGTYGRNWQRNQGRDFDSEPAASLKYEYGYIEATHNVYHWLVDRLEYNPKLDTLYREWANYKEGDEDPTKMYVDDDDDWDDDDEEARRAVRADQIECEDPGLHMHSAEQFASDVCDGRGIYGEGSPITNNTYNGEDMLSQVLQYIYWEDEDGAHVLLQIHGGSDVRGGYTDPVAFDVCEELAIFNNAQGWIGCECGASWHTDDSYHWYPDGTCGRTHTQLEDLEFVTDPIDNYNRDDPLQLFLLDIGHKGQSVGTGKVYVDDDGCMHCPICGGKLELWG